MLVLLETGLYWLIFVNSRVDGTGLVGSFEGS